MATFSLASALFTFDEQDNATGDPIEALEAVNRVGFRQTEIMADGEEWQAPCSHDVVKFRRALEEFDFERVTIHTPSRQTNLASCDESIRRRSVARIAEAIRFGGDLDVKEAIVHPSGRPHPGEPPYSSITLGTATEHAYRSIEELVRVAETVGVRIALENLSMEGRGFRPLKTMQELRAFIAGFSHERVGLCLDVGHACISGLDPAEQARVGSDRLCALHIQDVDGIHDSHWIPGQGVIDWTSLGIALRDVDFDGAWTIEVHATHSDQSAEQIARTCAQLASRWESRGMANPA
jgi:sugar phosphate isomerase/epimerase